MDNRNLSQSILETVAYYDVFSYPLTAFEIWKYLMLSDGRGGGKDMGASLREVTEGLSNERLKGKVGSFRGFYFIEGRQSLIAERIRRGKVSEEKIRKIFRIAKLLRFSPFVRMIGITGRVAMRNAKPKSDLDLFIIMEKGHIFTGRLILTGLVQLMGMRRHGRHVTDRICLNYFVATGSEEVTVKDLFASSEYAFMVPVFGREAYRGFMARNAWIGKYRPNAAVGNGPDLRTLPDSRAGACLRRLFEALLGAGLIERRLGDWQCRRIERDSRTKREGSMVFASGSALVFLPDPQGPKVFELFKKRLRDLKSDFPLPI